MLVTLKNIVRRYDSGQEVLMALDDISWSMESGEYVAITGASGSGKSTFMNVIGALDTPTSGKYFFQHRELNRCSSDELAVFRNHSIGFVFQNFNLVPYLTALENVMLPLRYAGADSRLSRLKAMDKLEKVGLGHRTASLPSQLSGGQQQRVAIARALVHNPPLILADEPTGALDSKTTEEIMNMFDDLSKQGVALIVVTHDMQVAARASRVTSLQDGKIISDFTNSAIKTNSTQTEKNKSE